MKVLVCDESAIENRCTDWSFTTNHLKNTELRDLREESREFPLRAVRITLPHLLPSMSLELGPSRNFQGTCQGFPEGQGVCMAWLKSAGPRNPAADPRSLGWDA